MSTISAMLKVARQRNIEQTTYHYHVTPTTIAAAIQNHKTMKHFVEEYYDYQFELAKRNFYLIRRRCLTDPGLQRKWFLKEKISLTEERILQLTTDEISSISDLVKPFCEIRFIRYILEDDIWIDLCAYKESGKYTLYFAVETSTRYQDGKIAAANRVMAFVNAKYPAFLNEHLKESKAVPDCPDIFPDDLRNTTPMHWIPLDKPLPKIQDPGRKRFLPLKLTKTR